MNGLERAISILGKLTQDTSPSETLLENFKKSFSEKYETQEIPLAEALDPEFGIGFPVTKSMGSILHNSLIEKIELDLKKTKRETTGNWLIEKIESFDNKIRGGIEINENDLKDFDDKVDQLPDNFSVMGTLLPEGKILIQSAGGTNANSLLGRFAYLDKNTQSLCKLLSGEENQNNENIVFAEIIHFSEGRIGNIARRPVLSEYEIPLLAASALATEKQLPIEDLMVSVQENEIIIRSKKLNKRIIPRLSNAHNYTKSTIPAYKFLCAIQHQGKSGFDINWQNASTTKKHFLPRVIFKNIILHRACWFLYQNEINVILNSKNQCEKLKLLFVSWSIPKFVCLTQGDNELFIDTTNDAYLQLLLEEIKKAKVIKLVEWLHSDNKNSMDSPDIIQFILPLYKMNPKAVTTLDKHSISLKPVQRTFVPGSEWLYFKIYTSAGFSDKILLNIVAPAINTLLKNRIIKKAFFIRYADPHYHIRFRLQLCDCADKEQFATAIKCVYDLLNPYCTDRVVWKVQLDTYQREIERYGEDSITASEEAFFHDSTLYLSCLRYAEFANNEQTRFLASLKNLDLWLSYFDMSLEGKAGFCTQMSNAFALEMDSSLKKHFDLKYRVMKNEVDSFLQSNEFNNELSERNKKLNGKALPVENVSSYIHISMNRWFATEQRKMEYMAYIFCEKYYNRLLHEMN